MITFAIDVDDADGTTKGLTTSISKGFVAARFTLTFFRYFHFLPILRPVLSVVFATPVQKILRLQRSHYAFEIMFSVRLSLLSE